MTGKEAWNWLNSAAGVATAIVLAMVAIVAAAVEFDNHGDGIERLGARVDSVESAQSKQAATDQKQTEAISAVDSKVDDVADDTAYNRKVLEKLAEKDNIIIPD